MKGTTTGIGVWVLLIWQAFSNEPAASVSQEKLQSVFGRSMEFFRDYSPEIFANIPTRIEQPDWIRPSGKSINKSGEYITVLREGTKNGELYGIIKVDTKGNLLEAGAHVQMIGKEPWRPVPKWSMEQAVENAETALKKFGWQPGPDMPLGSVKYTLGGAWELRWNKVWNGIPEVQNDNLEPDHIFVLIDEDLTGLRMARCIRGPGPEASEPRLTRSEAVKVATQTLPRLMATGLYRAWMPPGLSPLQLKSAELVVAVPDWPFNPEKRMRDIITERRLCWYCVFVLSRIQRTTGPDGRNNYTETHGLLHIYVDAVSAEIVGGNMEPIASDGLSRKFGNR